jgi:hypothetical protein
MIMLRDAAVPMFSVAVLALAILGCGPSGATSNSGGQSEMDRMAQAMEDDAASREKSAQEAEAATQAAEPTPPPVEEADRIGDSDKNREETSNPLLAAGHVYTFAGNQATLLQHKSAVKNFQATNGHFPKSHEEYVKEIVDKELVILPPPDEGYEYWYRPEDPMNIWVRPIGSTEAPPIQPQ